MKRTHSLLRRAACLLLAICLIAPVFCFSASAKQFTDLYRGMLSQEFMNAINYVSDNGWMNGVTSTTFAPYDEVTRGMFVTVLYRYAGSSEKYAPSFTDVSSSMYYYYPIGWAARYGIAGGVSSTKFEPESVITKEQMITMLYRFSKAYEGTTYSTSRFTNINQYPDYSAVSEYAREPMRWAKSYCVLSSNVDATYLNPQTVMNRAYASLYLANFSLNAGVWYDRDRYSFAHTSTNFHQAHYMSVSSLNYFNNCIDQYYSNHSEITNLADHDKEQLIKYKKSEWHGSCLGMTLGLYLDKTGRIDFNRTLCNGASSIYAMGRPIDNPNTVESVVNLYQGMTKVSAWAKKYHTFTDRSTMATGAKTLYNTVSKYGTVVFNYFYEGGGHSILVRHIEKISSSPSKYRLTILDVNNYSTTEKTLAINSDSITFDNRPLLSFSYYTKAAIEMFDEFDLDGYFNTTSKISGTSYSLPISESSNVNEQVSNVSETYSSVRTLFSHSILKTNSGINMQIDSSGISGNVDPSNIQLSPNGDDMPADVYIDDNSATRYELINLEEGFTSYSIISLNSSIQIEGRGIERIVYDLDTQVLEVYGNDMEYRLWITIDMNNHLDYTMQGHASGNFTVANLGGSIRVENLTGIQNYCYTDMYNYEYADQTAEFSSLERIDTTNAVLMCTSKEDYSK